MNITVPKNSSRTSFPSWSASSPLEAPTPLHLPGALRRGRGLDPLRDQRGGGPRGPPPRRGPKPSPGARPRPALLPAGAEPSWGPRGPRPRLGAGPGGQLELSSGRFRTRLSLAPAEGYPELLVPEGEDKGAFPLRTRMPSGELVKALTHVRYAASNEEYRAIFRGVQLEFSPRASGRWPPTGTASPSTTCPCPKGSRPRPWSPPGAWTRWCGS